MSKKIVVFKIVNYKNLHLSSVIKSDNELFLPFILLNNRINYFQIYTVFRNFKEKRNFSQPKILKSFKKKVQIVQIKKKNCATIYFLIR